MSGTAVAVTSIEVRECFGGNDVAGLAAQTCSRQTAVPSRRSGRATEKTPAVSLLLTGDSTCAMMRRYTERKQWLALGGLSRVRCAARRG